ncbi:MAG: SpoIID/LytB domain-containing protein [Actinomycetota bacterium]|nr:SpoIID/LytB domain-containing protein [Actinomycetota bacterium]
MHTFQRPFSRLGSGCALVLPAVLGLVLVSVPAATARVVSDSYWVPASSMWRVTGHGFGHGHGMSQYGAEGAAQGGLSALEILAFYYPGTTLGSATGQIRVLLTGAPENEVSVLPAAGLQMRDLGDGTTYPMPKKRGVTMWRLRTISTPAGPRTGMAYLTDRWYGYRPGGKLFLAGDGELSATGPLTLHTAAGNRAYRGALRLASPSPGSGRRLTVNVLSMDDYVKGVVPSEIPASWLSAALQSQAVAARTYASWSREVNAQRYYQICDTTACQVYGGVGAEDSRSNAAVAATAGQVLTSAGHPVFTQFSSSSGGWTSAGGFSYLPAKPDPYDGFAGNPVHTWTRTIDSRTIQRAYPQLGSLLRLRITQRDGNGDWHGRAQTVVLDGSRSDVTISGEAFRSLYGLRSSWFTIAQTPIMARWADLGGARSVVGSPTGRERAVAGGLEQDFAKGRLYYTTSHGARDLYGPILSAYLNAGGPKSRLGMPLTSVRAEPGGRYASFAGGAVHYYSATGETILTYTTSRDDAPFHAIP